MYLNKRVAQERDTAALLQTTENKGSRREGGRDGRKKEDMISYWKQSQKKGHESFKAIRARHFRHWGQKWERIGAQICLVCR